MRNTSKECDCRYPSGYCFSPVLQEVLSQNYALGCYFLCAPWKLPCLFVDTENLGSSPELSCGEGEHPVLIRKKTSNAFSQNTSTVLVLTRARVKIFTQSALAIVEVI